MTYCERLSITVTAAHLDCPVCERLAREAEETAHRLGRDSWLSLDERDGVKHYASYESEGLHTPNQPGDPS